MSDYINTGCYAHRPEADHRLDKIKVEVNETLAEYVAERCAFISYMEEGKKPKAINIGKKEKSTVRSLAGMILGSVSIKKKIAV